MSQDMSFSTPLVVSYVTVVYGERSRCIFINGRLAPATGSVVYAPGCILAKYTSGPLSGLYVNYDSVAGTNGQQTPVGVLSDETFNLTDVNEDIDLTTQDEIFVAGNLWQSKLFATQGADIAAYITAMNGRSWTDANGNQIVHIP